MGDVIVYTISPENEVVGQFTCERDFAIQTYFNQKTDKGRYLIANTFDKIKYPPRKKPLKDVRHSSQVQES